MADDQEPDGQAPANEPAAQGEGKLAVVRGLVREYQGLTRRSTSAIINLLGMLAGTTVGSVILFLLSVPIATSPTGFVFMLGFALTGIYLARSVESELLEIRSEERRLDEAFEQELQYIRRLNSVSPETREQMQADAFQRWKEGRAALRSGGSAGTVTQLSTTPALPPADDEAVNDTPADEPPADDPPADDPPEEPTDG